VLTGPVRSRLSAVRGQPVTVKTFDVGIRLVQCFGDVRWLCVDSSVSLGSTFSFISSSTGDRSMTPRGSRRRARGFWWVRRSGSSDDVLYRDLVASSTTSTNITHDHCCTVTVRSHLHSQTRSLYGTGRSPVRHTTTTKLRIVIFIRGPQYFLELFYFSCSMGLVAWNKRSFIHKYYFCTILDELVDWNSKGTFSLNPSHHRPHPFYRTAFTDTGLLSGFLFSVFINLLVWFV